MLASTIREAYREEDETYGLPKDLKKTRGTLVIRRHIHRITTELLSLRAINLSYFMSTHQKSEDIELICLIRKQETNHKAVNLIRLIEELILRSCSRRKSVVKI